MAYTRTVPGLFFGTGMNRSIPCITIGFCSSAFYSMRWGEFQMANRMRERKNALTREEFIRRSQMIHGDAYDYSRVDYRTTKQKVEIICRACGRVFFQAPEKHMKGNGCPNSACRAKRTRQTNLERYGVEYPLQSDEIRARAEASTMARYGVANAMQSKDLKERFSASRRAGGAAAGTAPDQLDRGEATAPKAKLRHRKKAPVFASSKAKTTEKEEAPAKAPEPAPEVPLDPLETIFRALAERYGSDGVVREYNCDRYHFACDFYIPSRDLFIEYNGDWVHGGHWYDEKDRGDREQLYEWERQGLSDMFYDSAASVWASMDCIKRRDARRHELNYVVFWDPALSDMRLWLDLGCPDGQDWERSWSWLPENQKERIRALSGRTV